jgi:hypothetical protein
LDKGGCDKTQKRQGRNLAFSHSCLPYFFSGAAGGLASAGLGASTGLVSSAGLGASPALGASGAAAAGWAAGWAAGVAAGSAAGAGAAAGGGGGASAFFPHADKAMASKAAIRNEFFITYFLLINGSGDQFESRS